MDENNKKIQREIAKDKIQIILASVALAVLVIMELYIMINIKSNFMAMAIGILLMILALFFLISALLDISLKQKDMEQEKYEEIYNAQKASYLVIKKSFDEMEQRLRAIEENSSLPAEDIINAQKAVAKVTISRSKENTDALMNSNDELINQLVSIQEKLEDNNSRIIEKQQSLLKETNFDIQQKIAALTSQISIIEGKIGNGVPVMAAAPVQMMTEPVVTPDIMSPAQDIIPNPAIPDESAMSDVPMMEDIPSVEETPIMEEIPQMEEAPVMEETPIEEPISEDIGLDLDAATTEEPMDDAIELPNEDIQAADDIGLDLDSMVEEPVMEEAAVEDIPMAEEQPVEETPIVEEILAEEPAPEPVVEEIIPEAPEPVVEEIISEQSAVEEIPQEDLGAGLDALLEEIGETVEPEPEPEPEPAPAEEPKDDSVVIPDVGVDLTDPNRVMSPEEIEKLFASI